MSTPKRLSAERVEADLNNIERCGVSSDLREHIAALEAELDFAKNEMTLDHAKDLDELDKLRADNARLLAALEQAILDSIEIKGKKSIQHSGVLAIEQALESTSDEALSWEDTAKKWRRSAQSLYAENAKLRAALEKISGDCYAGEDLGADCTQNCLGCIARYAFASTSDEALNAIREVINSLERSADSDGDGIPYVIEKLKRLFGDGK